MERLCIMTVGSIIAANDARDALKGFKTANEMVELGDFRKAKEEFERQYIIKTLQTNEGNVTRTSRVLGIERSHLYRKMKSLNISSDQYTDG